MMKIFDNWRTAGYVPPVIRNNVPVHWFTIEFHEKAIGHEKVPTGPVETTQQQEMTGKSSGKTEQQVLSLLSDNSEMTIPELAEALEITTRGVEKQLAKLRRNGRLRRIGPAKGGYWEVVERRLCLQLKTTQKHQETLGKMTGKILLLLQDNPAFAIPELAVKIGKSESAVERAIRKLHKSELLKHIGPDKGGYWEVTRMEEG